MESFSSAQGLHNILLYYKNGRSRRNLYRALRAIHGPTNRPTERTICSSIGRFETQFSLLDIHDQIDYMQKILKII